MPADQPNPDPKAPAAATTALPPEFMTMMQGLSQGIAALVKGQTTMQEALSKGIPVQKQEESEPALGEDDINAMPNSQFLSVIEQRVGKILEGALKPFEQQLGQTNQNLLQTTLANQIKEISSKHKDFFEWKQDIADYIKRNPNAELEDAYVLVRHANQERAREMDAKYGMNGAKTKQQQEEEAGGSSRSFGGLTPTSTGTGRGKPLAGEGKEIRPGDFKATAEAIYDQVMNGQAPNA